MTVRIFRVRAMECMCAQTRPGFILSTERVWGGMECEPMLTPWEKSPLPEKNSPQRKIEPTKLDQAGQRAQYTTKELFRPPTELIPQRLSCPSSGVSESVLAQAGPVPASCGMAGYKVRSATSISVWQHVKLFSTFLTQQIHLNYLTCCK